LKVIIILAVVVLGVIALIATLIIRADKRAEGIHAERWRRLLADGFSPDKVYKRLETVPNTGTKFFYNYLAFDLTKALCALEYRVFSIKDAVRVEMLNDATVVQSAASKFGGAGLLGVVVPGAAGFGGGSQSHSGEKVAVVAVRVTLDNPHFPSATLPFLFDVSDKASEPYRQAMSNAYEVYGIFEGYVRLRDMQRNDAKPASEKKQPKAQDVCASCGAPLAEGAKFCNECGAKAAAVSEKTAGQLKRISSLYEEGVLTQEEYEAKKRMLLETK
jgi:hypothetical protein